MREVLQTSDDSIFAGSKAGGQVFCLRSLYNPQGLQPANKRSSAERCSLIICSQSTLYTVHSVHSPQCTQSTVYTVHSVLFVPQHIIFYVCLRLSRNFL